MSQLIAGYGIYKALQLEGFDLPKECADVRLLMPVDGVMQLQMEVNLTNDDLEKLGRALVRMAKNDYAVSK